MRRSLIALLLLIPFAIGSQRCIVGALGYGGSMRCLAIPSAEAGPADAGCCHGPARASADGETAPAVPMKSCCIEGAPVPSGPTLDAAEGASAVFVLAAAPEMARAGDAATPLALAATESPPDPHPGPARHSRAPPRA